MTHFNAGGIHHAIAPILGSIRSTGIPETAHATAHAVLPFITLSRQAGAGGRSLAKLLAERLNRAGHGERPWECFDRELVEKIAADHRISTQLIESLETSSHTWLDEFFSGLPGDQNPSEIEIFHRVASTVRALAQAGRVILVGCGSSFITHKMPGGAALRLVARFEHRVATMSRLLGLPLDQAAAEVHRLDRNRADFYKRYWPERPLTSEQFALTLNSSLLSEEQMVECVLPLVLAHGRTHAGSASFPKVPV